MMLLRVVFEILSLGPAEIANRRTAKLKQWISLAKSLELEEAKLKESMEPGVAAILRPKRILLWRSVAEQMEWPDHQTL